MEFNNFRITVNAFHDSDRPSKLNTEKIKIIEEKMEEDKGTTAT